MPGMNIRRRSQQGFTLVEMMVAMAIGLIVTVAVIAFIVSVMRSNNQTIQATRLTQELRATMAVITADLKRARSVNDPMVAATSNDILYSNIASLDASTNSCVRYGYQTEGGAVFRAVSLANSHVVMATANASAPGCTTGAQIGSPQVSVTRLSFDTGSNSRRVDVSITGVLAAPGAGMDGISRTISETVYIRSK